MKLPSHPKSRNANRISRSFLSRATLSLATIAGFALLETGTGCGGSKGNPAGPKEMGNVPEVPANPCPGRYGPYPPDCCDADGLKSPPPPHCATTSPGPALGGGMAPGSGSAANPWSVAEKALAAADALAGNSAVTTLGGNLPQTEGATAGSGVTTSPLAKGAGSANPNTGSINLGGPGGGNGVGGGAGSGAGGSSSGFQSGGLKTSAMGDNMPAVSPSSAAASMSEGMYKAEGGGGGNGGSGSGAYGAGNGLAGFGGGGSGDGSDNGVSVVDMNGTSGSDSAAKNEAPAPEDPSDYFDRLKMGDNLFKVVERRYSRKARGWVDEDLARVRMQGVPKIAPGKLK